MTVKERKEIIDGHKQRHLEQLQKLGYKYNSLNAIVMLENKANRWQTMDCNGTVSEAQSERNDAKILEGVKRLFSGKIPEGFFINGDCRGYTLKLDTEKMNTHPISYTDWGGYMILAPEWK